MTKEEIIHAHGQKAEAIAQKYYDKFNNEVEERNRENVWAFIKENEKALSGELAELTVRTMHETNSFDLETLNKLRQTSLETAFGLSGKMQAQIV